MDEAQLAAIKKAGYQNVGDEFAWDVRDTRRIHRMTFYRPDGTPMPNLPADPYHLERFLRKGFTLVPPKLDKVEGEPQAKAFTCDVCGKTLSTKLALAGHKRSHEN